MFATARFTRPYRILCAPLAATRTLSSTRAVAQQKLFLVTAPDYSDAEGLKRRLAVRDAHLEEARKQRSEGMLHLGGAMLDDAGNMVGSTLIYVSEDIESVRAIVEDDVYYKSNVWDKARLTIVPFRRAL